MPPEVKKRYRAAPIIARFHRSKAFYRGLMGPVGSGKSTGCSMELFRRACAQEPGPDGIRRTRFAVVRNTYAQLRDTTVATWLDWFPEEAFGPLSRTRMVHEMRFADVSCEVLFRALDRPDDMRKLLSLEITGAWVNEARHMPKAIVDALGDRCERYPAARDGGCTWSGVILDTNPPDTDHWWHHLAETDTPENWAFFRQPGGLVETDHGFAPNPAAENLEHLPPDYYERRRHGKSADYVRVYYCGRYGFVQEGRPVWPEFRAEVHVASRDLAPVPGVPLRIGIDFGLTPAAVLGQRLPDGRWIFLEEITAKDMGMNRFAEQLKRLLADRYPEHEISVTGDPAGRQRAQTDERTPFDILRAHSIPARPAETNDFLARRETVALALSRLVDGEPGLVISPRCAVLIKGMAGGYAFRRVADAAGLKRDVPEKNHFSHVCDAAQYLLLGGGEGWRVEKRRMNNPARPMAVTDYDPLGRA